MAFGGGIRVPLTKESMDHGCPRQIPSTAYSDSSVKMLSRYDIRSYYQAFQYTEQHKRNVRQSFW